MYQESKFHPVIARTSGADLSLAVSLLVLFPSDNLSLGRLLIVLSGFKIEMVLADNSYVLSYVV